MERTEYGTADRDQVIRALREIALLLRAGGESEYRARAYETAANRLGQVQGDLGDLVRKHRLTELPGIGEALAARVAELVTTGRSEYLERLRKAFPPGMAELVRVPTLGTKKAVALWKALGVEDLAGLEKALREGRVRNVAGFGPRTEEKLLQSVEAVKRAPPRTEVRRLGDVLPRLEAFLEALRSSHVILRGDVAGGARRACEELADAQLVLAAAVPAKVFSRIEELPTVARVVRRDERTARVHLFEREVGFDVHVVPDTFFGPALLFATGSEAHVARLSAIAEQKGHALAPDGLYRGTKPVPAPDEADVYRLLDLPWIPPELREDGTEIDLAQRGGLPADLLTPESVRGVVHSHSTWSDGAATLEEMARAAKSLGYGYLTVTEHSPNASYAGGLTIDDLRRQWDQIDQLDEELRPFRLLKGIESDILRTGALDYPPEILDRLDVVIGSVHNRYGLGEREMTDRILRAMDDPHLHILGHLTGRLLQRREPYALRVDEILAEAARRGVAIEVNGNPHRLDLKAAYVREALRRGVKLVASADSHSVAELGHTRYAVLTARRGWATRADVLNTLDAPAFVRTLKKNRSR